MECILCEDRSVTLQFGQVGLIYFFDSNDVGNVLFPNLVKNYVIVVNEMKERFVIGL
jgi:hypothetical protein